MNTTDEHGPAIPIRELLGHTYAEAFDAEIVAIRCPRCELVIDAHLWDQHWNKECPAMALETMTEQELTERS